MKSFEIPCVGYSIAADWYEGKSSEVLLVLVGWSSNKNNYKDLLSTIVEQTGSSALVIDYTGHGESPFKLDDLTPAQNFLEVIQAFEWLKQNHPEKTINVMGTSYGGYLAAQLTKYRVFSKLVLRVPALYLPEDFYTKWKEMEWDRHRLAYRSNAKSVAEHPMLKRAANFKGKTLVVVHENDELVPRETTDGFIKTFNADTYIAKGFGHSFADELDKRDKILEYQKAITDWLNKN